MNENRCFKSEHGIYDEANFVDFSDDWLNLNAFIQIYLDIKFHKSSIPIKEEEKYTDIF